MTLRPRPHLGFSLLEVLVTVAVVGILALLAIESTQQLRQGTSSTKLSSDVATVNQAVRLYLASGGSLEGISDPGAVLGKLKTVREREDAAAYAGLRAEMIDKRLVPVLQTADEGASGAERAVWNAARQRFEIVRSGEGGVAFFALDEASGAASHGTEEREGGAVDLNRGDGWIWAYEDSAPRAPEVPTSVPLVNPAPVAPAAPRPPGRLDPPLVSVPGGTFRFDTFPSLVRLSNPNGAGGEILFARRWADGGIEWETYTGPFQVAPGDQILSYVRATSSQYTDSFSVSALYDIENLDLDAVQIRSDAELLDLGSNAPVTVELVDPNPSGYQTRVEYSILGGPFQVYTGPLKVAPADYAEGFAIVGRVVPTGPGFNPSPESSRAFPIKLSPPLIDKKQRDATFTVTLFDTNPPELGVLRYAIKDLASDAVSDWQGYQDPFVIDASPYGKGFEVVAYTEAVRPGYLDSDPSSAQGRAFFGVGVADRAILVLDISGSMAWNGRLDNLKAEAKRLLSSMPEDGKIGIITFSGGAKREFTYQTTSSGKVTEAQMIVDSLRASGSTNYSGALQMALAMVRSNPDVEQVVFLSDGAPTAGNTSESAILALVDSIAANNVVFSPIGYEMTTFPEQNLIRKMREHGVPQLTAP